MTIVGLDLLIGADRVISLRLKDPQAVARSQGALASMATQVLPEFVSDKVYEGAAQQIKDALQQKGIDAEVKVVDAGAMAAKGTPERTGRSFLIGAGLGAAVGAGGVFGGRALLNWLKRR